MVNISQTNINYLTGPEIHESFMAVGIIVLCSPNLFLWGVFFLSWSKFSFESKAAI